MVTSVDLRGSQPERHGATLTHWNPEDAAQWESAGNKIAQRNLAISIPSLLCAFAVWMCWGVLTVQMMNWGFPFSQAQLFTLTSIAGLAGATLRIPNTFFIRLAGGRNTIFFTTGLLLIPVIGTAIVMQDKTTPLWVFQVMALLSGIGGGNFASSMSNISFFFPKKAQGLALGLNAGLGNFGVTAVQMLVPLSIVAGFAWYVPWIALLIPLTVAAWFGMNNIGDDQVSPDIGSSVKSFGVISLMLAIGFVTSAAALYLMLPANANGLGATISKWLILPVQIAATVLVLKALPMLHKSLERQYRIFSNRHTWVMTTIYTMTFGSFIGFSAALPLSIKIIFGFQHVLGASGVITHTLANPHAPNALQYAWIGPFIGALARPVGGWLADRFGGARVTQVVSVVMVAAGLGSAYFMKAAYQSATPEQYFVPFLLLFLTLFLASGIGNGSTFRTVAVVFNKEQAGPVLGWASAIAAYGAFIIPMEFGEQIKAATPEYALYGFTAFYLVCLVLNWFFYLRTKEFANA